MERKAAPPDAVEYCPVVAFVSTGDPLFTLGDSRPIYEQLVAPYKRMIDDVLLRLGENAVVVGNVRSRTAPPGHRQSALGNRRGP